MSHDLFAWLLEGALATSAALLLVLALRAPLRRLFGARVVYGLWLLVPLALLAVSLPARVTEMAAFDVDVGAVAKPGVQIGAVTILQAFAPAMARMQDAAPMAMAIWLAGSLIVALWFWQQQQRFVSGLGRLTARDDGLLSTEVASACPVVIGAWSPRIVLPVDFAARYPGPQGELVLAHERVHLARGDVRINLSVAILRCAYWFNPLLHWAAARFRFDQELACDAAVLARFPNSRRAYADAMLKTQLAVLGLPVGCHWQSSQSLKERILMLKKTQPGALRRRGGSAVVAALLVASSYAAWALQPMSVTPDRRTTALMRDADGVYTPQHANGKPVASRIRVPVLFGSEPPSRMEVVAAGPRAPGAMTSTPAPPYPAKALASKQGGRVLLHLLVAVDGSVKDVRVVEAHPEGVFDAVSMEAAKKWKLQPPIKDGKPAEGWLQVPITFEPDRKPSAGAGANQKKV